MLPDHWANCVGWHPWQVVGSWSALGGNRAAGAGDPQPSPTAIATPTSRAVRTRIGPFEVIAAEPSCHELAGRRAGTREGSGHGDEERRVPVRRVRRYVGAHLVEVKTHRPHARLVEDDGADLV